MSRIKVYGMFLLLAESMLQFNAYAENVAVEEQAIKIGATLALSGPLAVLGVAENNGLLMGFEDFEKDTGLKVKLITEDNGGDAKTAVSSMMKLLDVDQVDIAISAFTHITQAIKSHVAHKGIPLIYISTSKTIAAENPLFFRDYYDIEDASIKEAMAVAKQGKKRVSYIREISEVCQLAEKAFVQEASKRNIQIISRAELAINSDTLGVSLLKAKRYKPDALVFCLWRDTASLMKKMAELHMLDIPTFHLEAISMENSDTPEIRTLLEKNDGISTWHGFIAGSLTPKQLTFSKNYYARFAQKATADDIMAYDLAYALGHAMKSCWSHARLDNQCFTHKLSSQSFSGYGGELSFGADRNSKRPTLLMRVKNGTWVEAFPEEKLDATTIP